MKTLKMCKNGVVNTNLGCYPIIRHNVATSNLTQKLQNTKLLAGRTYSVRVRFKTLGDGTSTSSKCSSIGFISYWDSWASTRAYIHYSATAYSEIGRVVDWTYNFTVSSDVQPTGTALYFIINNGWANGNDAQTIELYYYKYWDSTGVVYNESGNSLTEDCPINMIDFIEE